MLYASLIFYPKWKFAGGESTLGWDVSGYYWYLPSIFIYKDLKHQKFGDSIINNYWPTPEFNQSYEYRNGNRVNTYSSGMAVMYLPFFTIGHIAAKPLHYPTDGFSMPYQFAIHIGSLLFALLGLWYFRKLLLLFYDDITIAIVLIILVWGTNYLNYSAINTALTHNWLFTLYVFLILNTNNFYKKPCNKYAIRIGLLTGLVTLIRPSEIIAVLIPVLWGMENISIHSIKRRMQFFNQHREKIATTITCMILVCVIQVIYWLYATGKPFVYSYRNQGFSWLHPHFKNYMFSYQSGWLVYTPMLFLAFVGILPFLKYGKNKVAILCFFIVNLYIVCSWDLWMLGGRGMIQSYPILFFPLATLIDVAFKKRIWKWVLTPFVILFVYFNIWITYQAHSKTGLYDSDAMTSKYFWAVAGRLQTSPEKQKLKDTDELFEGKPKNLVMLYADNFERGTISLPKELTPIEGKNSLYTDNQHPYTKTITVPYKKDADWLRTQFTFRCAAKEWTTWKMPQFVVRFSMGNRIVKSNMIRISHLLAGGEQKNIYLDTKIPVVPFDSVSVFIWNAGSDQYIIADNLKLWSFNE
jgi:hypothetical protein